MRMINDSMTHAADDIKLRQLREEQIEAERLIVAIEAAMAADAERLLNETEIAEIKALIDELREAATGNDSMLIKDQIEKLNEGTTNFAARRMNEGIHDALVGHNVQELSEESSTHA
jgi:molecular chaperone HscA